MADPNKMSVADILAAARKQGAVSSGGAPASDTPAAAETPPPAPAPVAPLPSSTPASEPVSETPTAKPAAAKPAAAAGAKPGGAMSVADILAAARAQKAGGTEAAPAPAAKAEPKEKPAPKEKAAAAAKPKAAEAAPAAKAAAGPAAVDTSSILAAARGAAKKPGPMSKAEAAKAETAEVKPAAKAKATVPPMPEKPAYAMTRAAPPAPGADDIDRRGFLDFSYNLLFGSFLAVGFTTLGLTHLLWVLGLARFMFPNILIEPPSKFKVGKPDNFPMGQVENKFKAQFGVWIVHFEYLGQEQIYALKSVCTHLGCTPNWLEAEQKFKCPCHGSGFYKDGINFEGPAPRPLERYAINVADDGQLEVDKSRTFQEEMGAWKDPGCFVQV